MRIGGDATVRSYWKDDASYASATFEQVAERLPQLVPAEHVHFLGMGEDVVEIGDYVLVHAGIQPGVPIDKQALSDIRDRKRARLGKAVTARVSNAGGNLRKKNTHPQI